MTKQGGNLRKVIYSMMVSLDGFIETPDRKIDWIIIDDEIHSFANDQAREMGAFLYGRRIYELMAAYWPTGDANPSAPAVEIEFARIWREKPKIVFSKTLEKVEWNSRLVKDNLRQEVLELKAQPGKDLSVSGAGLAASFMRLGLIDEFQPIVNPVVLGSGTPFFPPLDKALDLRLVETRNFAAGVVFLRYQLAGAG
jgi:dihydrofolate reductase